MDLSIIVVSYNTRSLLASCLSSIASTVGDAVTYEVIVVDNASVDGSAEMVDADFASVRLIRNTDNRGFAAANNQALQVARGRYALLLNSDAIPQPGTIESMVSFMDASPRVGVLGGRLLNPDGSFQSSSFDFPSWKSELLLISGLARWVYGPTYPSHPEAQSATDRRVDWVSGALFMVRRAAIDQVGALDEAFFMYAEEMDWCYRMRAGDWEVAYTPRATAVHVTAASAHRQPERRRAQVYSSKCLFARKHWSRLHASVFIAAVQVFSAAKLAAWWVRGQIGSDTTRERAAKNVTSYRFLLGQLPGAF